MKRPARLAGALGLVAGCAIAQASTDLPSADQALATLARQPAVASAHALVLAEEANRRRLSAGPHEASVRLGGQRRSQSPERYSEWDIGLEKALRLPGKARADELLGAQGVEQARIAVSNAVQEAARTLVRLWFAGVRADAQAAEWREHVGVLERQLGLARQRVRSGDASRLDQGLAEAALAQAQSALLHAEGKVRMAANELALNFPELRLEARPVLAPPEAIDGAMERWRAEGLQHSRELAYARGEVRRAALIAGRADAERMPDPTVGVRYGSERGGAERVLGFSVAIALPGQARAAEAQAAAALAQAAATREAAVLRKVDVEIANHHAQAKSAFETWRVQQQAARRMQENAELLTKAYGLGESGVVDALNARRLAVEARLATTLAQADAREAHALLLLTAGRLWRLDDVAVVSGP